MSSAMNTHNNIEMIKKQVANGVGVGVGVNSCKEGK
jgi:hypothetical protein